MLVFAFAFLGVLMIGGGVGIGLLLVGPIFIMLGAEIAVSGMFMLATAKVIELLTHIEARLRDAPAATADEIVGAMMPPRHSPTHPR